MKQLVAWNTTLRGSPSEQGKLICIVTTAVDKTKTTMSCNIYVYGRYSCLNDDIECSFMIPCHTRFGPDWCFGLIKLKYKRSYVSSVSQLGDVVSNSTTKSINVPQHVSDPNSGETLGSSS